MSDLSPLAGLEKLRDLDLSDNRVTDLWPLAGLYRLERLNLSGSWEGSGGRGSEASGPRGTASRERRVRAQGVDKSGPKLQSCRPQLRYKLPPACF